MTTIPVNLAVEDPLSESVLRRLTAHVGRGYAIGAAYNRGGNGYLKRCIRGWNQAAKGRPLILLTDLDQGDCPQALMRDWLPVPRHPNLLFRVAVREVEAWLLSDRINLAHFLRCSVTRIPTDPENLPDPKVSLVNLATSSRSTDIRDRLVPRRGHTAKQGPDYNACLAEFVQDRWDIAAACLNSKSLRQTVNRLEAFTPAWE